MGWGWADHELATGGKPGHHHDSDCDAGGATNGTNQIGELCAVLEALRAHPGSEPLVIETDSQYAINCSTTWVHGWKKNGWKNSQKKPVKNADLIRAIDAEISKRPGPVKFVWVKGHAGNAGNEKVDELARTYAGDCRSKIREGYLPLEGWQSLLASEYSQGTDVPDDAQMLLDGKITTDEYHMGRGQGKSAQGSLADDLMGAADPEPRPRSIADMLVEPEGYPAPDEATLPLTSNEMSVESDDMPEPTTALDTTMPDGTTPDAEAPRKSYAEMLLKPDCFPHEHDQHDNRRSGHHRKHRQTAHRLLRRDHPNGFLLPQTFHNAVMQSGRRLGFVHRQHTVHLLQILFQRGARWALCQMLLQLLLFGIGQSSVHTVRAKLFKIFLLIHAPRLLPYL